MYRDHNIYKELMEPLLSDQEILINKDTQPKGDSI